MPKIYLIRHCESEGNACRRAHAQTDSLVTCKGYAQCQALAKRFEAVALDAVYASDTYRSIVTADPIAQSHGLPVKVRITLREVTTGIWEDESWGNIAQEYPELCRRWQDTPWEEDTPGATSLRQVGERILYFVRKAARELDENGAAAMVTHSVAIKAALCMALGEPLEKVLTFGHGENTSVSCLQLDAMGNITVEYMNDSSHLPPELQRAWSGLAKGGVNMAVYPCSLQDAAQKDALLLLARQQARQRGAAFDEKAFTAAAKAALAQDPQCIALGYLDGRICGYIWMETDGADDKRSFVRQLFTQEQMQGHGYAEQLFGYAIHVLRYRDADAILLDGARQGEMMDISRRFAFESDDRVPGWLKLNLYTPLYRYRVLA